MTNSSIDFYLRHNLKELYIELSITKEIMAKMADLSRNHISAIECGEKSTTVYAFVYILNAVRVPFGKFFAKV